MSTTSTATKPPPTLLEQYLPILVQVAGRIAIQEPRLREIIGDKAKHLRLFNLADGSLVQTALAKKVGMTQGGVSLVFKRWSAAGAIFHLGEGRAMRFLHIYPLAPAPRAKKAEVKSTTKRRGKRKVARRKGR